MKRQFPGLHAEAKSGDGLLEGVFLARVDRAFYRWHPQKPFFSLRFSILEPKLHSSQTISGRLYCTPKALWKLNWFLRDFGYDSDLFARDEIDERSLLGLNGVVKTSRASMNHRSYLNLDAFAPVAEWENLTGSEVGNGERQ